MVATDGHRLSLMNYNNDSIKDVKIGNFEIIIVDDGSTDDTAKIAKQLSRDRRIRLIRHKKNLGLGAAIRTGIANSTGDLIVFLDADFTFHPSEIPKLEEKLKSKLGEKLKPIRDDIKIIKEDVKKISKDLKDTSNYLDKQNIHVTKNVQIIQKNLKLPVVDFV